MTYEIKPNTGSLFKNDHRPTDQHPNMTGTILITTPGLNRIGAWTHTRPDGSKYLSLKATPKDQVPAKPAAPPPSAAEEMDDTIPF